MSPGPLSLSIDAIRPLNRWDDSSIRPGVVGSVGDALVQVRYKHSNPDMPLRFDPSNSHRREPYLGSNVQDGQSISHCDKGGPNFTIDSNWGGRRGFKTSHGWYYQDVRAPDRRVEPIVGATPQYDWHNKIAQTYNARVTGDLFLPLPGEYMLNPGDIPRGGSKPRVTDEVGGDADLQGCYPFGPETEASIPEFFTNPPRYRPPIPGRMMMFR